MPLNHAEDEPFITPPRVITDLGFHGSDTIKCMEIFSQGEWPITHRVQAFHLPGHWSAVYVGADLVQSWGWTDAEYLEALQFALDLHKLQVAEL